MLIRRNTVAQANSLFFEELGILLPARVEKTFIWPAIKEQPKDKSIRKRRRQLEEAQPVQESAGFALALLVKAKLQAEKLIERTLGREIIQLSREPSLPLPLPLPLCQNTFLSLCRPLAYIWHQSQGMPSTRLGTQYFETPKDG